jgi:hypothetical protein
VNTRVDPAHCGNCTTTCATNDKCIDKVCRATGRPDAGHPGRPDAGRTRPDAGRP